MRAGILISQAVKTLTNTEVRPDRIEESRKANKVFKYPFINSDDFKTTMSNFSSYVNSYNETCRIKNKDVKSYNQLVKAQNLVGKVTEIDKKRALNKFNEEHNSEFVKDYNQAINQHNQKFSLKLNKRLFQSIKWNSTLYFKAILGFYVSQIKRNNLMRMKSNVTTTRSLERVSINSYELANCQSKNELLNLAHAKTFQRHAKRFREAGILTDYIFINSKKPVYANINPEILAISDGNSPKSQNTKNQPLNYSRGTKCSLYNHTTRTLLNEIKMKAEESAELPSHAEPSNTERNDFYKNPRESKTSGEQQPQKKYRKHRKN